MSVPDTARGVPIFVVNGKSYFTLNEIAVALARVDALTAENERLRDFREEQYRLLADALRRVEALTEAIQQALELRGSDSGHLLIGNLQARQLLERAAASPEKET